MVEELRVLGINVKLPGAGLMEQFVRETTKPEDLNSKQRKEILEAWDTRNYVPIEKLEVVDRVQPDSSFEKGTEAYEKEYVELIYKYLQTV